MTVCTFFKWKFSNFNIFLKLFASQGMKNMFECSIRVGFNFICCRLKNCLVYQKSIFLWVDEFRTRTSQGKKQHEEAKNFKQFILPLEIVNASWIKQKEEKNWWKKIKRTMKLKCFYLLRQYLSLADLFLTCLAECSTANEFLMKGRPCERFELLQIYDWVESVKLRKYAFKQSRRNLEDQNLKTVDVREE